MIRSAFAFLLLTSLVPAARAESPDFASGRLPDGRTFKDATEFKKLLADQLEPFVHAFTEKLAT